MAHWNELEDGVWYHPYPILGISANAMAIDLGDKKLAVLSPPPDCADSVYTELDELGDVVALIAPGGHDLGQASWQKRYPDAGTYAAKATIPLFGKIEGLREFKPLSDIEVKREGIEFIDAPGSKVGSPLVRAGGVTYIDEIVGNQANKPGHPLFWLLFSVTGSSPGLKLNKVYCMMFCKDKQAVARAALDAIKDAKIVLPAHGEPLRGDAGLSGVREQLNRIL